MRHYFITHREGAAYMDGDEPARFHTEAAAIIGARRVAEETPSKLFPLRVFMVVEGYDDQQVCTLALSGRVSYR